MRLWGRSIALLRGAVIRVLFVELMADRPDVVLSGRHVRVSVPARLPRLHAALDAVLRTLSALPPMESLPVTMALDYHQALGFREPRRPAVSPPRLHPAQIPTLPVATVILAALLALSACQTRNATPSALPKTPNVDLDAARTDSPVTPAPLLAWITVAVPMIQTTAAAVPPYSPALLPVPVVAARPPAPQNLVPRRLSEALAVEAGPLAAPVHPNPGSLLEWEWPA